MNKRVLLKQVAVAVLAAVVGVGSGVAQQKRVVRHKGPVTVQLLAINDLHGNLEPPAGHDGTVNGVPAGGAEYLATHLKAAAAENPNSIVVGAGDIIGGSPFVSAFFDDKPTIEAANAMGLSVTAIGNHELDHGPDEFLRRTKEAKFQYLGANVVRRGTPETPLIPATAVRVIGGVKVGFIGETLEGTPKILAAKSAAGLRFEEETGVANAAAARLERQGVHAIVLLIHQGGLQHPPKGVDPEVNGCVDLSSSFRELVEKLSPAIKVVISGHTHEFYNCEIDGHTVTSAGSYGRLFTRVNLVIDPQTDAIESVVAKNVVVTRDVAKDPTETAILAKYLPEAEKLTQRVVGSVTDVISRKENAAGERALGDVIADAQLESARDVDPKASIALMNSGGIRADITGTVDAAGKRTVTFGDLAAVQPFGNRVVVVTMTGEMLRRLLEQQFAGRHEILQVSDGFTYQYRAKAEDGQHVVEGSMKLHGRAIAPTDVLRVAASDFLLGGGDGMTVLREGKKPSLAAVDLDALLAYFHAHSPVKPGPQDRILRVE